MTFIYCIKLDIWYNVVKRANFKINENQRETKNVNGGIKMEVINVSKHYGHSIILKDINFKLNKGEIVGLVGRNGVGKSTLMKILVQNNQPTSGNII